MRSILWKRRAEDGNLTIHQTSMLSGEDFNKLQTLIRDEVRPLKDDVAAVKTDVGEIKDSIDQFLTIVRRHDEEWLVLRAQHVKMRNVLIEKGIATETELSATS